MPLTTEPNMSSSALPPTSINHTATSKASRSTYATQAEWVHVKFAETAAFKDVYGFAGNQGMVNLEGIRWLPKDRPSKTLLVYMHPASNLQLLPMPRAMAEPKQRCFFVVRRCVARIGAMTMSCFSKRKRAAL